MCWCQFCESSTHGFVLCLSGTLSVEQHPLLNNFLWSFSLSLSLCVCVCVCVCVSSWSLLPYRFGSGPHRVKFTVEFTSTKETGSFVMELAPLDLMPHAVHNFLKQVSLKLWDRTVFWHHEGVDHVISAATVMYQTGEPRHHHFDAFGVGKLSFAEYSPDFPHELYTVGYTGKGPNFYINARNNTDIHGPGEDSEQRSSSSAADPCFARIVEGLDVVHNMYLLSIRQSREALERREWHDHELTHILSAEIL